MLEFGSQIAAVANGHGYLLDALADLSPGSTGVVDIDFTRKGAHAWAVGIDVDGSWWQSRVELTRTGSGEWRCGASSTTSWDDWAELAASRPEDGWPEWGPILGLAIESGDGSTSERTFTAISGIASNNVAAVEVSLGTKARRRVIDSPTGGFILAVPFTTADQAVVRAIRTDGRTDIVIA